MADVETENGQALGLERAAEVGVAEPSAWAAAELEAVTVAVTPSLL